VCYARIFGEPLKIYHGLSFFFLRAVFLLSFSKEGRKMRNLYKKELLKKNYKIYSKYPSYTK